ncbi:MAG: hypothetical protein HYV02_01995 [Deltaproteobacteria bacterium]|nr:hypothetical protein [Deltaproteobacteria bacterium]
MGRSPREEVGEKDRGRRSSGSNPSAQTDESARSEPSFHSVEIIDFFRDAHGKETLLDGCHRFLRRSFRTIIIFAVTPQGLRWLAGAGPNMKPPQKRVIPWRHSPLLRRVAHQRHPYVGPIPADPDERGILIHHLHARPERCWLYPAAVGEQVDCLIYADTPLFAPDLAARHLDFVTRRMILALRRSLIERLLLTSR